MPSRNGDASVSENEQIAAEKARLRRRLRAERLAYAQALDPRVAALVLRRPPAGLAALVPQGVVIGVYAAIPGEAPALGFARHFHEAGHPIALPWFAGRAAPMQFRQWLSPWLDDALEPGPFGAQPGADAPELVPQVLFVPLVGFTPSLARLGQGGGHYDRWLGLHPEAIAIGLAWDCQMVDALPSEPHDAPLAAIVTPTRLYGPAA